LKLPGQNGKRTSKKRHKNGDASAKIAPKGEASQKPLGEDKTPEPGNNGAFHVKHPLKGTLTKKGAKGKLFKR